MIAQVMENEIPEGDVRPPTAARPPKASASPRANHWAFIDPDAVVPLPRYNPLPYLVEARLFALAQAGDVDARNTLWLHHARLALSVVNGFRVPRDLLPDLVQETLLGLYRAIQRYDVKRYISFSTYAWHWLRNRAQRFLWRARFSTSVPAHLYFDYVRFRHHVRQGDALYCQRVRDFQPQAYKRFLRLMLVHDAETLSRAHEQVAALQARRAEFDRRDIEAVAAKFLAALRPKSADIVRRRFGLSGEPCQTLSRVAQSYHLSRERIRQLEEAALHKLRLYITTAVRANPGHVFADYVDGSG